MIHLNTDNINLLFEGISLYKTLPKSEFHFLNPNLVSDSFQWAVLIVQEESSLSEAHKNQLFKILNFMQQNPEQTPIAVCSGNRSASVAQLSQVLHFKKLMVYGGNREILGLQMDLRRYVPVQLNAYQFVCCDKLEDIILDKNKAKLKMKNALELMMKS